MTTQPQGYPADQYDEDLHGTEEYAARKGCAFATVMVVVAFVIAVALLVS